MRYTNIERTLMDSITSPDESGGFENVLSAWGLARDRINLEVIVSQIERTGTRVLQQRAGFILERLGFHHPRFAEWKAHAPRGGSSKLVAAIPYATTFDEQWNLSINVPIDEILDDVA
jgi:predicted transcriptional regulator of viral defense system